MKYKLIIFDMDGTILNTLPDLSASLNHALKKNGLPERSLSEVRSFVGNGIRKLIERGVPEGTNKELTDKVYSDFSEHYEQNCANATAPYDGITEVITEIRNRGMKTAVVSNKIDSAVKQLAEEYFGSLFDMCVGESDKIKKKPAPDEVEAVLRELNIKKEEALFVGDSEVDIETSKNAGLPIISVTWGFKDREFLLSNGAKTLIDKPQELLKEI
ncbi:MAG: HAD-IA family hydrolase [Oscillospiraceae bacterium]|nr:HAD-IA family hydrolase [Oscillospiraceae bacterium]